jgi:hypothetical protein
VNFFFGAGYDAVGDENTRKTILASIKAEANLIEICKPQEKIEKRLPVLGNRFL